MEPLWLRDRTAERRKGIFAYRFEFIQALEAETVKDRNATVVVPNVNIAVVSENLFIILNSVLSFNQRDFLIIRAIILHSWNSAERLPWSSRIACCDSSYIYSSGYKQFRGRFIASYWTLQYFLTAASVLFFDVGCVSSGMTYCSWLSTIAHLIDFIVATVLLYLIVIFFIQSARFEKNVAFLPFLLKFLANLPVFYSSWRYSC